MNRLPIPACAFAAGALFLSCATATIRPGGGPGISNAPTFSRTETFFFWGLMGEHTVDVAEVCPAQGAEQMQTQRTFKNVLLTAVTLGIYAPKTAKVWCK
jgi:hypothetical protein